MGQKKVAHKRAALEDPPSASSSTEEDEQLTDQEEEQEHHNQEPAKKTPESESSEDEEELEVEEEEEERVEKNKPSVQIPFTPTTPQHPQSSDSDPGSDSETHLGSPTASGFTIKPVSPQPKKPTSGKRLMPEFEKNVNESLRMKKKAKVVEEAAEKKKKEKKKPGVGAINRLWSEEDEVVILEGLMGLESPDMGELFQLIKKSLSVDVSKSKFVDKIHKLKRKYKNNVKRGDKAVLSRPHEHKCFELSKKVWGGGKENNNGGDGNAKNVSKRARKTVKRDDAVALPEENDGKEGALGEKNKNGVDGNGKGNGSERARKKSVELDDAVALPREESGKGEVALGEGSKGGEMKDMKVDKGGDFWAVHKCLKQSLVMETETPSDLAMKESVKSFMMENMSMIGDVKAKELEKKWKDLYVDEVGLYLKRVQLMEEQTKLVFDAMKASKD